MDLFCKCHQCPTIPSLPYLSRLFALVSLPVPTDPPRLPRCSPERLKKSWSCQPLGDGATEPLQGRRQSGESHVSPEFLLSHVFPPHCHPFTRAKLWLGDTNACG